MTEPTSEPESEFAIITGQEYTSVYEALRPESSVWAQLDVPPVLEDPFRFGDGARS